MKTNNFLKKMLAIVLVFAMLAPTMGNLGTNVSKVQAEDTATGATSEKVIYEIVSKDDITDNLIVKDTSAQYEKCKDYLFAGWYQDAAAKTAAASKSEATCARFVPAELLNVKCQVTNGLVTDTSIDSYKDKYVLRFVSSIDSLDYKNVGFEISYTEDGKIVTRTNTANKVFKRIESTTGLTSKGTDMYEFSPKVISTKSEYFVTAKWPVAEEDKAVDYTVRAFWTTKDGTKVYGADRCVSVEDGLEETCKTRINLPLQNTLDDKATYSATYKNASNTEVTCSSVEVLATGTDARLTVTDKNLKSVTEITIKDSAGNTIETVLYRNLYTEYTGTADTTWYDKYSSGNEFIIATSADLYGLASLVNATENNVTFADKIIYVVSDIKVNKGIAKETGWIAATGAKTYMWTPIGYRVTGGSTYYSFKGTFDGQSHTISGIYYKSSSATTDPRYGGLFGPTNSATHIQNLKLTNSYFESASSGVGSITGYGYGGTFDTVYSNAIVKSSNWYVGGLVGLGDNIEVKNCWFAGSVINTGASTKYTAGIVATTLSGTVDLSNCLVSGTIDVSANTTNYPYAGGLLGHADKQVTIGYSLNTGDINVNSSNASVTYGGVIGYIKSGTTVDIDATYNNGTKCAMVCGYNDSSNVTINNVTIKTGKNPSIDGVSVEENVTGDASVNSFNGLFKENTNWKTVTNGTPILVAFKDEIIDPDISWYTEYDGTAQEPYILYDEEDMFGLSLLSKTDNFAGKVIRLGADIVVNKGNADDWAECTPKYEWTPIGQTTAFAGTFDGSDPETGEIHSISGIYLNTSDANAGLFGVVETTGSVTATIQNLKLKNSYFETTKADFGSIAGRVKGATFDTIYSDAIVVSSNSRVGGFIGIGTRTVIMNSCWFAGNVKNTYNTKYPRAAAFVGNQYSDTLTMTNCLNTGTVDVSAYTVDNHPLSGCFVGEVGYKVDNTPTYSNANVTITDCLNTGKKLLGKTSTAYGEIIGYVRPGSEVDIDTTYIDTSNGTAVFGYNEGTVTVDDATIGNSGKSNTTASVTHANMSGETAKTNLTGFDFDTVWTVVANSTPILTSFASKIFVPDTTWYDASEYTYILYNRADLYGLAELSKTNNFAGKTIKLGADIVVNEGDAEDWAESAPKYKWTPIGPSRTNIFAGTFDGSDPKSGEIHSISGLYLNTTAQYIGLFGVIQSPTDGTATVQNLKLTNSYFETTQANCGSIAGWANGAFDTVYSDAIVIGSNKFTGGFVGMGNASVIMNNCWFAGATKNASTTGTRTGGFIGNIYSGTLDMTNCLNTGLVDVSEFNAAYPYAGGFVGEVGYPGNTTGVTVTLEDCLNTGRKLLYGDTTKYGALTGYLQPKSSLTVTTSYVDNSKWGSRGYYASDSNTNSVSGYTEAFIEHDKITGSDASTNLAGFDFETVWTVVFDGTVVLQSFADEMIDESWYSSTAKTFTLNDKADLYGFVKLSQNNNFAGKTVKLGADIAVNEGNAEEWDEKVPDYEWQSIGSTIKPFAGTFDGQGHTISGVYLNTDERYAGLFKWIQTPTDGTATVQNLKLTNSYFETNGADCGSIAGRATGAIHTVYSDAIVVSNNSRVGGFVGMGHTDLDMDECWFAGRVVNTNESRNSTGGFLGNMYVGDLSMDNCLNTGVVDVSANRSLGNDGKTYYPKAGGFIGLHGYDSNNSATATITNCLNTGTKCVYDVVKTSYGAFTGYMNPTSSLTVNSSYVDSDKCDGRGYFAADYTTNPVDGYTKDIFKSYEEITGTNAETSLDGFDFTSTWTVAESGNVILACFEEMEVLETSTNALHQTLIVNEELNVSEVTSVATLPKTSNWSDTMSYQGGCTTDGRYFYQALITYKDEEDKEIDGTPKEADNLVKIFKYDKDTQQVVWSEELNLNHANDITYNSKLGYFVVCHNQGGANKVSYISIDTDEETGVESINLVETVELEENIYSIDYNSKYDQYIVGMSGGQEFTVFDSSFQQQYSFKPKAGTTPNFDTEEYVTQGICCDDKYIYCILENPDVIVVYDWFGRFVSEIRIENAQNYSAKLEPENISVLDDTIYFTAFSEGEFLNYQNSAVVYKFSATDLVEQ